VKDVEIPRKTTDKSSAWYSCYDGLRSAAAVSSSAMKTFFEIDGSVVEAQIVGKALVTSMLQLFTCLSMT
jgi:hypothetical protein